MKIGVVAINLHGRECDTEGREYAPKSRRNICEYHEKCDVAECYLDKSVFWVEGTEQKCRKFSEEARELEQ